MPTSRSHQSTCTAVRSAQTIALTTLTVLFILLLLAAPLAQAQTSVPPTARHALTMPQYASKLPRPSQNSSRLPHPYPPQASFISGDPGAQGSRGYLPADDIIYTNGPINGTTDAWTINFGFAVSNTFTVPAGGASITSMSFGAWLFPGDVIQSVEVLLGTSEFGSTISDQVINLSQSNCSGNQYGFNVCTVAGNLSGSGVNLSQGTYWVTLQNATVNTGDPAYWDENSGPSMASQNSIGTIPSEAFSMLGTTTTTTTSSITDLSCPQPQAGFQDLHDFNPGTEPSELATNSTGNLYGALANSGSHGAGVLYSLAQRAGHWFVSSLYDFLGGSDGGSPGTLIVGPDGTVYGAAAGDIQSCGYYGNLNCGVIYEARPSPTPCSAALCTWNQTTIYQFRNNTDAWGGQVTAFDSAGNLYGISSFGGAYGRGAIFELSPSEGGWTETILHSFTGGSDGASPGSLLMGRDGYLYGTSASGGSNGWGIVFQFVPSGMGWTENVIYNFTGSASDGFGPRNLIQDASGNFYGTGTCFTLGSGYCADDDEFLQYGMIFALSHFSQGWGVSVLRVYHDGECVWSNFGQYDALAVGRGGHLYAVESAGLYFTCSGVYDVSSPHLLISGPRSMFSDLISDANGNLYGTSPTCGFGTLSRTDAMVWQLSP